MKLTVFTLAIGQTLLYACLYYLFPATLLEWEAVHHWKRTDVTLAFTLAIGISALCAPFAGRFLDRDKGPELMAGCIALGAGQLWLLTYADSIYMFYLLWFGIGIAMSGCLYETVFAFLVKFRGKQAKSDITLITLVAGFASTLCFPSIHYLLENHDLTIALKIASLLLTLLVVPFFFASRQIQQQCCKDETEQQVEQAPYHDQLQALSNPNFWLLAVSFSLLGLAHSVIISHLLPLLEERSLSADNTILIASLIGPMQVIGRIVSIFADRKLNLASITLYCFAGSCIALATLYFAGSSMWILVIFVLFQGSSYGVIRIMKPLVTKQFMGEANFGTISGLMALPYLMFSALAPYLGSLIWEINDYDGVLVTMVVTSVIAFGCFGVLKKREDRKMKIACNEVRVGS
ncbi:MFS transporter [Vibrio sp. McD22-P3]|uniref:MFS transporter n=1 Tax=Vibrio sp. McD22-P3 TaxID=2724880 RepID=UPI001F1F3021|nr:MFS transporter [Vibrio sp. McD22-P3]MCF4174727.1 MFS transporter [Vibrio sp. McD22-P3]